MSEIKYDPELPYAIKYKDQVWARFLSESDAHSYVEREGGMVVDTTPKPKIPEGAEFIYWKQGETDYYARRTSGDFPVWVDNSGDVFDTLSYLLSEIGDAEVTVLVRKEDA